mmetsp:Transcript_44009/g.115626  ORF Transcript_44009/g.115626 Transcript_44009/m.115626 type:complete len:284 (+) Transcript_44009:1049-1900(+)
MRDLAMTGIEHEFMTSTIMAGSEERATPPSALMSAGMRSRAITATAPASSAMRACSPSTTSMITPPFWKTAKARLAAVLPNSRSTGGWVHGAATSGLGTDSTAVASAPHTSFKKRFIQESSEEISGWKQVAMSLPCLTATTAPSGTFSSAATLASTSTPSPTLVTAGARMKYAESPALAAAPATSILRKAERDWRPKALRLTVMSRPPTSGCAAPSSRSCASRISPAQMPHVGFSLQNSCTGSSSAASTRPWPMAVLSPPGRMSASTSASSAGVRTSTPSTPS